MHPGGIKFKTSGKASGDEFHWRIAQKSCTLNKKEETDTDELCMGATVRKGSVKKCRARQFTAQPQRSSRTQSRQVANSASAEAADFTHEEVTRSICTAGRFKQKA